jgi:hypothetical protein
MGFVKTRMDVLDDDRAEIMVLTASMIMGRRATAEVAP